MTVREGHHEDDLRASCHYSPLQEARETGRNGNDHGRVLCRYYGTLCGEVDIYGHYKTQMYFPNHLQGSEHLTNEGQRSTVTKLEVKSGVCDACRHYNVHLA